MTGPEPKLARSGTQAAQETKQADAVEEVTLHRLGEEDEEEEEDLESYDEEEDGMFDPMQELGVVLEPFNDTLQGILEALEKQNKILYKLASVVEALTVDRS